MIIELSVNRFAAKATTIILTIVAGAFLIIAILANFIIGVLTDERTGADRATLAIASSYFPTSAPLQARLAAALERENELTAAESHALSAARLSPCNFNYKILLASIEEANGKTAEAEQSLRESLALAPNKAEAHWQMANLWLRQGKFEASIDEFRVACAINKKYLPVTCNLLWRASNESLEAIERVAGTEPQARLALAHFLLKQGRETDAARVYGQVDRYSHPALPESAAFLNALITSGHIDLARACWLKAVSDEANDNPLIWNGSFEAEPVKGLAQFDWAIGQSEYAKFKIVGGVSRTGSRALRIDFLGRDTTRIGGEVKQTLALRGGTRYRMECYAKAEKLITPEGLRLVVTTNGQSEWHATSQPLMAGELGWQRLELEFVAPDLAPQLTAGRPLLLYVTISRKPKFSYDEPTRGTVWLDDFTLTEVK